MTLYDWEVDLSVSPPPEGGGRTPELEADIASLYQQHSSELLRYAESMVPSPDEARDAVQEAYLRYFMERRYGRLVDNPRAWLFQVLRNHLLDRVKGGAAKWEMATEGLEQVADRKHDPEKRFQCRELAELIAGELSVRELDCLRLRTHGMDYAEIAKTMDLRLGTVGALLSRVRKKLQATRREWRVPGVAEAVCSFLVEGRLDSP